MKKFTVYQPTEIVFGRKTMEDLGTIARRYGRSCLLVTSHNSGARAVLYERIKDILRKERLTVAHYDGVIPNPTTDVVSAGARMAREAGSDLVIGLGGGSSMDTAKAIAVEVAHEGTAWDYLFFKKEPSTRTLPIIAVPTTSGTGSQTTPCAVITNTAEFCKSAIWHPNIFARVAVVDPDLASEMPPKLTACTGFDAFCHNFEAYISVETNPYAEALALEAIRLIAENLPAAVDDGSNATARDAMAWADTLGGIAISTAGVTLPHGVGMQIGGHCPSVAHGESLAVFYPEFTRFTWSSAVGKFAAVGRTFNKELLGRPDSEAAHACCDEIDRFLKRIGLWIGFRDLRVGREEIRAIASKAHVLPDYRNNPRLATLKEVYDMLSRCYER
ncbi:MAG TPA: iron-containing alcohol dehydrogenase [Spirochaetes bacterium]|nr:iron-containing alcohol dehydrogenase [Spirochaetota bacterium]